MTGWDELQSRGRLLAFGAVVINLASLLASRLSELQLEWIRERFTLEIISLFLLAAGYLAMKFKLPRFLKTYPDWQSYESQAGPTSEAPITQALQELANDKVNETNGVGIESDDLRRSMVHFRTSFCKSGPEFVDDTALYAGTITKLEIRKRSIPDAFHFTRHLVGGAYSEWWRYGTALALLIFVTILAGRGILRIFELIVRLI